MAEGLQVRSGSSIGSRFRACGSLAWLADRVIGANDNKSLQTIIVRLKYALWQDQLYLTYAGISFSDTGRRQP